MADKDCESESIISILDQMAESVPLEGIPDTFNEPSSSGIQHGSSDKDDKYWERRRKNNLAAKKSRDARKIRENQLRSYIGAHRQWALMPNYSQQKNGVKFNFSLCNILLYLVA